MTGSRGFVGRHLAKALHAAGWDVHGIDIKPIREDEDPTEWFEECRDVRRLFTYPSRDRFDLVVHCAAVVGGRQTIEKQPLAVATDLSIDSDLFNWAARAARGRTTPPRIVYFSSSAAYPWWIQQAHNARPLKETDITIDTSGDIGEPDHIYGWVKLTGEKLANYARSAYGIPVQVLRPFSGYGPDQDLDYPFPAFIHRAATRADPFDIWGDGGQARDFIHIDDVIDATLAIIDNASVEDPEPINLCTGVGTSMYQLAEMCVKQAGYDPWLRTNPDAPTGVHTRVGDPTQMREFWVSKITIEEGVKDALLRQER